MKEIKIRKAAEADGKCFECGQYVMECGCWLKGLSDPYGLLNQPERSKREDSCKDGHDWCHIPLSDVVDCKRCGALNSMET